MNEKFFEEFALQKFIAFNKGSLLLAGCDVYREMWRSIAIFVIDAPNESHAWKVWHSRKKIFSAIDALRLAQYLKIKVNGRDFAPPYCPNSHLPEHGRLSMVEQKLFERGQRHSALIRGISIADGVAAACIHDASESEGFRYLDISCQVQARLNKPKEEMLFAPATIVDSQLAELRVRYLREANQDGMNKYYSYDYHWEGILWRFNCSIIPIPGSDEILSIVSDAHAWQTDYWKNRYSLANLENR